jgi:hypothetical protein
LRWVRVDTQCAFGRVESTCWTFDERPWNLGRDFGYGVITNEYCGLPTDIVTHVYETTSYDLPANGPRVDLDAGIVPSWDLQAYQVTVPTFWQGEWSATWQVAEEVPCPGDEQTGSRGRASPPNCDDPDNTEYDARCDINSDDYDPLWNWEDDQVGVCVSWSERSVDWSAIDLRRYGYPTPYYRSYKVVECGRFNGSEWCQESEDGTVPTPIIESQPILINSYQ